MRTGTFLPGVLPLAKVAASAVLLSTTLGLFRLHDVPGPQALWPGQPPATAGWPSWLTSLAQGWYPAVLDTFANMHRLSVRSSIAYVLVCVLCTLAFFAVPFISSRTLRIPISVVFLFGISYDLILYDIGGDFPGLATTDTIVANAWFGLEGTTGIYTSQIFRTLCLTTACLIVFALQPPRLPPSWRWLPAGWMAVTIVGVAAVLWRTEGYTRDYPSPISSYIDAYTSLRDNQDRPIQDVEYGAKPSSAFRKIILIVDESVRGDYLSLNDPELKTTPFLVSDARNIVNFGVAVSSANCSVASRTALRFGLREKDLGTPPVTLRTRPTIWQYARLAGLQTVQMDAFGTAVRLMNGLSATERSFIDRRIVVDDTPLYLRDQNIAQRLVELMNEPTPMFIFVEKYGTHIPYDQMYPPSDNPFGANLQVPFSMTNENELVRHYENAIAWSVDAFFAAVLKVGLRPDTLLLYTSDHGQSLSTTTTSHCHAGHAGNGEAMVPLLAMTSNRHWRELLGEGASGNFGRASHFEIFPTLLAAMGYDPTWVSENYDRGLVEKIAPNHRRRFLAGKEIQPFDRP